MQDTDTTYIINNCQDNIIAMYFNSIYLKEKETQHSFADYWIYTAVAYGCDTCKLYSSIG